MAKRFLSNIRINDAYTFPASDGTDGQVIKTDGSGSLTFGQVAVNSASVMYKDTFTGDGSTTVFNMANALNDEVQSNIYIDGVYQSKSTYSVLNKAITFSTAPLSGHAIEVISTTGINSGPTAIYTDTFTGNGSTTAFTLAQTVHSENQTLVFLNGVYQFKNTYTLSGTTLTLDTAPANSVAIEVMSIGSAYSGGDILYDHDFTSAGLMTTNGSGTYSISTAPTVGDGGLTQNNFTNTLKSKLDAIEASATADQTNAEIKAAVEAATDSNTFTDADHSKLNAIEASATVDQTDAEIRTAVEAATDSNVFTDADHTKLNAIEASADVTDTTNVTAAGALMDSELAGIAAVKATTGTFLSADESKLDGIEASADVTDTANVTSAGALMDSELTDLAAVKAINQGLTTSSNVAFGNITATGYLRGPASFTIDPATHGDDTGTLVIAGNLQVDGTTTTINSTTVAIDDLNFSIATDAADSAAANGAGITIGGASATLLYTHATTSWDMNKPLNVTGAGTFSGIITAQSSSSGDYVRMYGSSGTGKWDIYGNGANLRISDNESAGILVVDTAATFAGTVLIGTSTTTPSVHYDNLVIEDVAGNNVGISLISANGNNTALYFGDADDVDVGQLKYSHSTNDMFFVTNAVTALTIDSSQDATFAGNVTIEQDTSTVYDGTSNQTGGLWVNNIYHEALNTFSQIRLGVSGASGASSARIVATETAQANSDLAFCLRDGSGYNEVLRLKGSNQYIGIGTDSPSYKLQVSGAQNANDIVINNTTTGINLRLQSNDASCNVFSTGALPLTLGTNNITAITIDSSQNATFAKNLTVSDGSLSLNKSDGAYISLNHNSSLKGYLGIANQVITGGSTGDIGLTATTNLVFGSGGTTERMRIDSDGNVLINATSKFNGYPTTFTTQTLASGTGDVCPILELVGNRSAAAGNQNAMIQLFNKTSTAVEVGRISSIQGSATNSGELGFMTANAGTLTERMRIDSSGVVQISNTGAAHLILNGDTNNSGDEGQEDAIIDFLGDGNPGIYGYRINTENYGGKTALHFQEYLNGSYTSRLKIDLDGNVGIGTTSPVNQANYTTLCVNGTNSALIEAQVGTVRIGGIDSSSTALYFGSIGNYPIIFRVAVSEKMRIDTSGNVGIGSSNPLYPLNVAIPYAKTSTGTQQFAAIFTTNEAAASAPFGLRIGIIGAAAIANRYAALQTTDYGLADGGNIVMQAAGGNVGIGTTSPDDLLHIYKSTAGDASLKIESSSGGDPTLYLTSETVNRSGIISFQDNGVNAGRIQYSHNGDTMEFYTGGTGATHLELSLHETAGAIFDGKVGIGTTPAEKLDIYGAAPFIKFWDTTETACGLKWEDVQSGGGQTAQFDWSSGTYDFTWNTQNGLALTLTETGTLTAVGDIIAYSDERLKDNIKTLDGSKVYKMRGVSFDKNGKKGSGVIAQELEKIAPELVNNDSEYKGVAYGNLTGYLIEAIKELKQEIDELKSKQCNCKSK